MKNYSAKWPNVPLEEICRPKQWPTIQKSEFTNSGYPVFGANGKIGYYSEFNHKEPTVLITCRGATCGTIGISTPYAYVTGNAMALDDLDVTRVSIEYLVWVLRQGGLLSKSITGSAQPQITKESLKGVLIPLPPLTEQRRIAAVLDRVDALRAKRRKAIVLLDDLAQSIFLDMFGDPTINRQGWPRKTVEQLGQVTTGNTPLRADESNYGHAIEWIKSDNIDRGQLYLTRASEYLSSRGMKKARIVGPGALLVTCIAGSPTSIGNVAIADRTVAFNQQINALEPRSSDSRFLYAQLRLAKRLVQEKSTGGMKGLVSKSQFESILLIDPPLDMQREFSVRAMTVDALKMSHTAHLAELDALFASLQYRAFRGELFGESAVAA